MNRSDLDELATALEGTSTRALASGELDGVGVTYRQFATQSYRGTQIDVFLPSVPLVMFVRRAYTCDAERVERAEMVDLDVGDDAFDARFIVEGAPPCVVVRLVDRRTRELLDRLGGELRTFETKDARPFVRLELRHWLPGPTEAIEVIREVVRLAGRAGEVTEAVEREARLATMQGPYRPNHQERDRWARDPAEVAAGEVARVGSLIRWREARDMYVAVLFAALITTGTALFLHVL